MKNKLKTTIIGLELVCFILFMIFSGYGVSSLGTRGFIRQMGFAIGMTAGVEENGYNTIAQALKEKETILTERERYLAEKEAVILRAESERNAKISFLAIGIGSVLLGLILLNFYLDAKRRREADYIVKVKSP
jgi:hypothetical protein